MEGKTGYTERARCYISNRPSYARRLPTQRLRILLGNIPAVIINDVRTPW